jgi:hypothetical protein
MRFVTGFTATAPVNPGTTAITSSGSTDAAWTAGIVCGDSAMAIASRQKVNERRVTGFTRSSASSKMKPTTDASGTAHDERGVEWYSHVALLLG